MQDPLFFILHSYFRQENIYLMQDSMQCMIVPEYNVRAFKFVFHLNLFYFLFSDLLLVLPVCSVRACSSGLLCFCPLLGQTFCLDDSLSHHNFLVLGAWNVVIYWFLPCWKTNRLIFFVLNFILDFRVVNKIQNK